MDYWYIQKSGLLIRLMSALKWRITTKKTYLILWRITTEKNLSDLVENHHRKND